MLLLLSSSENGMVATTLGSRRGASAETCGPQARGGGSAYTTCNSLRGSTELVSKGLEDVVARDDRVFLQADGLLN